MIKKRRCGIVFSSLLFLVLFGTGVVVQAVTFDESVTFQCDNENYRVGDFDFEQVIVSDHYVVFNNTDFNITSTNPINLTLSYINSNIPAANVGDTVLSFTASTTAGTVWFNLSGFSMFTEYSVFIDDVFSEVVDTTDSDIIHFNHSSWSEHDIDIVVGDQTPSIDDNGDSDQEPDLPPVSLIIYVECNGEPIDQAKVTVDNVDKITGSAGRVTYSLIPDVYTILVFNPLYGEMSEVVDLTESKTVTITYDQETEDDSKSIPGFEFFVFGIGFLFVISFFYYRKKQSL